MLTRELVLQRTLQKLLQLQHQQLQAKTSKQHIAQHASLHYSESGCGSSKML
jgi:hypothetical protein